VAAFHGVWARGGARVHLFGNPYGKEFLMHLVAADRRFVRLALVVAIAASLTGACNSARPLEPGGAAVASNSRVQSVAATGKQAKDTSLSGPGLGGDAARSAGHTTPWF
jgi:hypothetical protein